MSDSFDAYHKWLAIPPEEQPPHHYRLLGVKVFEDDPDVVDSAADQRMAHLRSFQSGKKAELAQKLLNEVSAARVCLLSPDRRAAYDDQLRDSLAASEATALESGPAPVSPGRPLANTLETPGIDSPPAGAIARPVVRPRKLSKRPRRWVLPALLSGGSLAVLVVVIAIALSGGEQEAAQGEPTSESKPPSSDAVSKEKQATNPSPEVAPTSQDDAKLPGDVAGTSPTDGSGEPTPHVSSAFAGARAGQEWDGNALKMKFCWCPPGKFTMGSPKTEADRGDNEDQVDVTLTRGFWLGKYEVTQAQWKAVMGTQPWVGQSSGPYSTKTGDEYPAAFISWEDASKFCLELTMKAHSAGQLPAHWEYRLPTEAQWEYACRASSKTRYGFGDDISRLGDYGWYGGVKNDGNAKNEKYAHQVGVKRANLWGFHDLHGNVQEWCRDWYNSALPGGADPEVTTKATERVTRGGGWGNRGKYCRSARRTKKGPSDSDVSLGFRVACVAVARAELVGDKKDVPLAQRTITNSIGMKLAYIPAGEFLMGSPRTERLRQPDEQQHRVRITQPFRLGVYEVTQQQYEKVMGTGPWQGQREIQEGPDNSAAYVSWDDAVEFCRRLSEQEGVEYRLPTEAEWEYACRAGTTTAYSFGDSASKLREYAWYNENARHAGGRHSHRVGQKLPNPWGLYDIYGNVWEWCQDWSAPYDNEHVNDPGGPAAGSRRVLRGGGWYHDSKDTRSARRWSNPPPHRSPYIGFRVAMGVAAGNLDPDLNPPDLVGPTEQATPDKLPAPSDKELLPAIEVVRETFSLDEARSPEEQLKLAREIVAAARNAADSAERFVLLRTAMALASQSGDATAMLAAVAEMERDFEIQKLEVVHDQLLRIAGTAGSEEAAASLVNAATTFFEEAIVAERADLANSLADAAYNMALSKPFASKFRKPLFDQRKRITKLFQRWQEIQDALAVLKSNPEDPAANSLIGAWHCFDKNDWETGLPFLAKSDNAAVSEVARRETTSPLADGKQQLAVADAWWDVAQQATGNAKGWFQLRALHWYEQCVSSLGGIEKIKVEKRLEENADLKKQLTATLAADSPSSTVTGSWDVIPEHGFLTYCHSIGPFPRETPDDTVLKFLARAQLGQELMGKQLVKKSAEGKDIKFRGPLTQRTEQYYVFLIEAERATEVTLTASTFTRWSHSKVSMLLNFQPLPSDWTGKLNKGRHIIIVKQDHDHSDRDDRSWIRLHVKGDGLKFASGVGNESS